VWMTLSERIRAKKPSALAGYLIFPLRSSILRC
jgi:hypothetical protein